MLNSAEAVVFPSVIAPPMIRMLAIRSASSGCVRSSSAMFVSGPTAAMVTGSGDSLEGRPEQLDGALGPGRERGSGRSAPSRPLSPWTSRRHVQRPHQRAGGARRDGDVRPADQRQDAQRVVASWRRSPALPATVVTASSSSSGRARPSDEGEGVVVARIAIEDERDPVGHRPEYAQVDGHAVRCAIGADRGDAVGSEPASPTRARLTLGCEAWRRTHAQAPRPDPVRGSGHLRRRLCGGGGCERRAVDGARRRRHRRWRRRPPPRRGRVGRPVGRASERATVTCDTKLKVGLVTDVGRINDKGFNQSAYEGMKAAKAAAPTCFDTDVHRDPEPGRLREEHRASSPMAARTSSSASASCSATPSATPRRPTRTSSSSPSTAPRAPATTRAG